MLNSNPKTIGRLDRAHLETYEIGKTFTVFSVLRIEAGQSVLKGYITVGQTDEGYTIRNIESWTPAGDSFYKTASPFVACVKRVLSVEKLEKLLNSQSDKSDLSFESTYGKLVATGKRAGISVDFYSHADGNFAVDSAGEYEFEWDIGPVEFAALTKACGANNAV